MKIAFIYLGQQGGGNSIQFLEFAKGLSLYSEVLCVLSNKSDEFPLWESEAEQNKRLFVLGVSTTKNAIKGGLEVLNFYKFHQIRKQINAFSPDVVYSAMGHPWERVIVPFLNCKFTIQSIHDVRRHQGEDTFFMKIVKSLFSYQSTKYVVFSEYSKRQLLDRLDEDKIWTLSLGCTNSLSQRRELDLKYYGRFLFFGRLIEYKGIDVLLNAMDSVIKRLPNIKLVLAGRGDLTKYKALLDRYSNNIELHNDWIQNEDIDNYFRHVDFVVAPYIDATQSGVVPLSYVFGKPVIVSNSGGLPEQVEKGKTGVVIETGDTDALADAIISFYKDEEELINKKKCAYDMSRSLTWAHTAKKLCDKILNHLNSTR